jgi:hypothetical protein
LPDLGHVYGEAQPARIANEQVNPWIAVGVSTIKTIADIA